jgi:hypothetical protein
LIGKCLLAAAVAAVLAGCERTAETPADPFRSGQPYPEGSAARPWTHLDFRDDPDEFQFAIITDRTGGPRPGVFEGILAKVNLLQPEFVMSVGDYIEGYSRDKAKVVAEWEEIEGMTRALEPPLFYVVGNHEIFDAGSEAVWHERRGAATWYSFLYKDVLFLALNTEDTRHPTPEEAVELDKALALVRENPDALEPFMRSNPVILKYLAETQAQRIGDRQTAWVLDLLETHRDARWVFLFMHRPVWRDGIANFGRIEQALAGRGYTMFAGHLHSHAYERRNGADYIRLGTSGGGWSKGGEPGEMDHVTWVTVRRDGPVFAHLLATGILAKDAVPDTVPGAEFCGQPTGIECVYRRGP